MRTDKVADVVENFRTHLKYFSEQCPYSGPSLYFHCKAIASRREKPLDRLLQCDDFIELLYAVLVSWGMNPMTKGARMKPFDEFRTSVRGLGKIVLPLERVTLSELTDANMRVLCQAMDVYTVMDSDSRLVGNSKVLHHLLPDLVPPIDRKNILEGFLGLPLNNLNESKTNMSDILRIFRDVVEIFKDIHDRIDWTFRYDGPMNTSKPKLIDNAIIGYNLLQNQKTKLEKKKQEEELKKRKKEEKKKEKEEFRRWKKHRPSP